MSPPAAQKTTVRSHLHPTKGKRIMKPSPRTVIAVATFVGASALASCGTDNTTTDSSSGTAATEQITITNCDEEVTYDAPVQKLFVNDGNIISIALAAGAREAITAVSSIGRDEALLQLKYGSLVDDLNVVAPKYPTLENVVAAKPDVMFAGWNYGFSESKGLTPETLADKGIASYTLSESCRSADGTKRGTMDAWDAIDADLRNIGTITGNTEEATKAAEDITARRKQLEAAPQAEKPPVIFLFDSAQDEIFTSGYYGAPEAMITTAGATNATTDVKDTWTRVSWERLATADPDIIAFVDYPPQTFDQKVQALTTNPASKDLTAVKEKRFVNLPYAMWTSGPLNIDGAQILRAAMEHYELQPTSEIQPTLDLQQLDLPGNDWLTEN